MSTTDPTDGRERGWCPTCGRGPFLITKRGEVRVHSTLDGTDYRRPMNCRGGTALAQRPEGATR